MSGDGGDLAERAYRALRAQDYDEATALAHEHLETHPDDPAALAFLELVHEARHGRRPARWEDEAVEQANDFDFSCILCGHDACTYRPMLFDTRILTFLDLEWLNKGGRAYVCSRCGFVHPFMDRPESPWMGGGVPMDRAAAAHEARDQGD